MNDETYGLMNEPDEVPIQPAPAGPIAEDLPCRHCGYNLRGMTEDRACPECGTAVGRSLLGDQLRFSDPQWVRTLARGAKWILTSVLLGFGLALLSVLISLVYTNSAKYNYAPPPSITAVLNVMGFLPSVVYLVGVLFITAPEPGVIESADWSVRNVLRWAAVASTAIGVIHAGLTLGMTDQIVETAVALAASVVGMVGYISLFVYALRLALRVPDYDLAKQTKTVMWGIIISLSGMILVGIIALVLTATGAAYVVFAIPVCIFGVAYLVFAIWSLVLLFRYNRAASTAAEQAEQTWASGIVSQAVDGTY